MGRGYSSLIFARLARVGAITGAIPCRISTDAAPETARRRAAEVGDRLRAAPVGPACLAARHAGHKAAALVSAIVSAVPFGISAETPRRASIFGPAGIRTPNRKRSVSAANLALRSTDCFRPAEVLLIAGAVSPRSSVHAARHTPDGNPDALIPVAYIARWTVRAGPATSCVNGVHGKNGPDEHGA